ncbi:MAG: hypothetical protein Q9P01_20940 [Anaerolineae bacterium]|nr:hypothetical protein [Anaerolineae bacterium]MDQ7037214.1 hypothetical protein [Anaerolineae bacterium]
MVKQAKSQTTPSTKAPNRSPTIQPSNPQNADLGVAIEHPELLTPGMILQLQATHGNQFVQRMLKNSRPPIQREDDESADVAAQALVQHESQSAEATVQPLIQREGDETEEKTLSERINEALDGWGADVNQIMEMTQTASAAEKQTVLNDTTLMSRLSGELNRGQMLQLLGNLNALLRLRLTAAMDGWGADVQTIISLTRNASDEEKQAVLDDSSLISRLSSELSRESMVRVLTNINAPLSQRITVALNGWGEDFQGILDITAGATAAEKREVATDQTLMTRLIDDLSDEQMQQVSANLGIQNAAVFTNSTDTGNEYTSLATLFPNGLTIAKDVKFIEEGTFGEGGFDALNGRLIAAVTSYLSNKFKVKITPGTGGEANDADGDYPIEVKVNNDSSANYPMHMHGGLSGRSAVNESEGNIYELGQASQASIDDITLAHESAHMVLGASDEYANASVSGRVVSDDNSLLGNYYTQGVDEAEIKARHFQFLVQLVSTWYPDRNVSIKQV